MKEKRGVTHKTESNEPIKNYPSTDLGRRYITNPIAPNDASKCSRQ